MALQVLDFVKFKLASSFNPSTDTTVTIIAESDIYTLALQRQGVDVSNFRLTIVEKTDTSQFIRVSVGSIASQATVDGKLQYVCNIQDSDASNAMVGLANDDDGTNGDANIIAGNVSGLTITEFSTDSVCIIAVGSAEYNELKGVFTAGTTTNTAEAGEDIESLDSVSLHTDGKLYEYHSTNYPNLVGAVSAAFATAATATYTTFGGVSTGHSGLTVGATQYAENTGTITETSSTTTTILGTAESATTIRVAKAGDSVTEFSDSDFKIKDNSDATKIAAFEASGITTATTRTFTLPDESGTVLTDQGFDIADNVFNVVDDGDATKKIAFQASGITTGTTRTITMPDADVNLGGIAGAGFEITTLFDSTTRFTKSVVVGGGHSFGSGGLVATSGSTVNGQSRTSLGGSNAAASIVKSTGTISVSMLITPENFATDLSNIFIGISQDNTTTGNTMFADSGSNRGFGFLFRQTSSALNIYGMSRYSATTSVLLQTFTNATRYLLSFVRNGSSSIDFYVNGINKGTITTNIPPTLSTNEYVLFLNANNPSPSTDDVKATIESYSVKYII